MCMLAHTSVNCKCGPHLNLEAQGAVMSVRTCCKMDHFLLLVPFIYLHVVTQVLKEKITASGKHFVTVLLSEVFPDKLKLFQQIDA